MLVLNLSDIHQSWFEMGGNYDLVPKSILISPWE